MLGPRYPKPLRCSVTVTGDFLRFALPSRVTNPSREVAFHGTRPPPSVLVRRLPHSRGFGIRAVQSSGHCWWGRRGFHYESSEVTQLYTLAPGCASYDLKRFRKIQAVAARDHPLCLLDHDAREQRRLELPDLFEKVRADEPNRYPVLHPGYANFRGAIEERQQVAVLRP